MRTPKVVPDPHKVCVCGMSVPNVYTLKSFLKCVGDWGVQRLSSQHTHGGSQQPLT